MGGKLVPPATASALDRTWEAVTAGAARLGPGLLISATIAMAAMFVSEHYGGPVMLYALLLGIAFNFLSDDRRFAPGIGVSCRNILRIGVALLGLRVSFGEIASLGLPTVALVVTGLAATITLGWAVGRALGLSSDHAVLSAGAVAICGASAALAISAALPRHKDSERNTILTVVGVTALSTVCMVAYPMAARGLALPDQVAGIFIGATIHDVAQVVGAGYTISEEAGNTAAIVKLMRVTCLSPVVFIIAMGFRQPRPALDGGCEAGGRVVAMPAFLLAFVALVALNSLGVVPGPLVAAGSEVSRICLVIAVAALGSKTSLGAVFGVGTTPFLVLLGQTIFLAAFALVGIALLF